MKYLILAITIALIGCSDDNSSITGTTIHVIDNNGRAVEELKSPLEWCADELSFHMEENYGSEYIECATPITETTYYEIHTDDCNMWALIDMETIYDCSI